MEEIQEDPKRDALIDALMEELEGFISRSYTVYILNLGHDNLVEIYKASLKDRLKEILDHERDRVKV